MSPNLVRPTIHPPAFLSHPEQCHCSPCCQPQLHVLLLQLLLAQASCFVLQEELEEAKLIFTMIHDIYKKLFLKTSLPVTKFSLCESSITDNLTDTYLSCLIQIGEFLSWYQFWDELGQIETKIDEVLKMISVRYHESHPCNLVKSSEQMMSLQLMRKKMERMKKALEEERMMEVKMSLLKCNEDNVTDNVVTPDVARQPTSRLGQYILANFNSFKSFIIMQ